MPASETTFYNIKRLHAVFAMASLALVAVTVWMLAKDHWREWKVYQRTFRDRVEPWLTEAERRQTETAEFEAREKKLTLMLRAVRSAPPDWGTVQRFCAELKRRGAGSSEIDEIETRYRRLISKPGDQTRQRLLARLSKCVAAAESRQETAKRRLRLRRAEFDEARSFYEAGVGEGLSQGELDGLQRRVDRSKKEGDAAAAGSLEASTHCEALAGILGEITGPEDAAQQAIDDHRAAVDRFDSALADQRPSFAKRLLRMPLVDAFGRPLAIDQIWLPELTIDYNFRRVARFDRCRTCHQAIGKTRPGLPFEPACRAEETFTVELAVPDEVDDDVEATEGDASGPTLESLYGFALAPSGILDANEPTVGLVRPRTAAADADLLSGDVILKIDGAPFADPAAARRRLLDATRATATPDEDQQSSARGIVLEIRRGLGHPYGSHPRLDLLAGSLSPHPISRFGCTICHEGQGSATAFRFASHTPNDPIERVRWRDQHDWFWNEHWDFPMRPARFLEAGCLKCHHTVTDLAPSRRFPDPPAPKLLAGYDLIRRNGCFGCHEIRGVTPGGESVGPDMRLEPNDPEAASDPTPGTMRKVGPSLRDVAGRLDADFLDRWLRNPRELRPETRMPRFYGLDEHLHDRSLDDARRFEAAEVHALADYLLSAREPVEPLATPAGVAEPPSAERGKRLFLTQGCLACHRHDDFPEAQSIQGADLSGLATKLTSEAGKRWLESWIRDPARHSPRTLMPNVLLAPVPIVGEGEDDQPRLSDPAADIAAYLLALPNTNDEAPTREPLVESDLDELVVMHLTAALSKRRAEEYVEGAFELTEEQAEGDAVELLGQVSLEKKLRYVGRRTLRKRGCYGCHDLAGFDDAQPIGPALSDWGRKQESLLAFERVGRFVAESAATSEGSREVGQSDDRDFYIEALLAQRREGFIWQKLRGPRSFDYKKAENKGYNEWLTMGRFAFTPDQREAVITFVLGLVADPPAEKYVFHGDRRGRAIAEGRKVLDRYACAQCHVLEMQRWQVRYDPEEIEEPYETEDFPFLAPRPDVEALDRSAGPDRRGLVRQDVVGMPQMDDLGEVLEDVDDDDHPMYYFNLWEPLWLKIEDQWTPWTVGGPQLGVSDPLGVATGRTGDAATARLTVQQQGFRPTYAPQLARVRPAEGGAFARLLFPHVLDPDNPAVMEAWGWLPPPLAAEGSKVRPEWLRDYLLEPIAIRPAAVLQMPKYNMSPAEAQKLVDYFAATAGVDFPYNSEPPTRSGHLEAKELARPGRLDDAMRILIDRTTFCTKCHLVGDYSPGGETRTVLAPRLDRVGGRLRRDYVRRWVANPKTVLPYTGMPVNFRPVGPPLGQESFQGSSMEQLDAVTDLLLDYDWYMNRRNSIRKMIESEEQQGEASSGGTD